MIALINRMSGGIMYVHESRVEEYLAAGHSLAAPPKPDHPLVKDDAQPKATKAPVKKPEAKAAKKTTKRK